MKSKPAIISLLVFICIVAGIVFLLQDSSKDSTVPKTTSNQSTQSEIDKNLNNSTPSNGSYIEYSEDALATAQGTTLLFFHAPWCPQCRALEKDIQTRGVPSGVTILKVDYDSNQALRKKYGVTLQTTLVKLDGDGNSVKKYVAYDSPTLAAVEENLL